MKKRVFYLRTQILEDMRRNWTIEEMAKTVGIFASHFQKFFKAQTGSPPIGYLRELRLEKAKELLENTFLQINQIGYEAGMPDHNHFTRDFKKKFGVTPIEYRRLQSDKMQAGQSDEQK